tara:strand:- start:20345 stop:21187 length:843 start_codon:yes stop_codon:yes gene_type:complete
MKWVSFCTDDGYCSFGLVKDDAIIDAGGRDHHHTSLRGALESGALDTLGRALTGERASHRLSEIALLPIVPDADKVLAIGRNYKAHLDELGAEQPEAPRTFIKHMSALVGSGQPVVRPKVSERFDYEGELCAVIGIGGRHIEPAKALDHVAGYTLMMYGSVRDFQKHSVPAGKNFDKSGSVGPFLVTSDEIPDPSALTLLTRINGETVQESGTDMLIYDIPTYIAYLSQWMELKPGDIIASGTPGGVGQKREPPLWLKPGDVVEVEIAEIGILTNPVVAE